MEIEAMEGRIEGLIQEGRTVPRGLHTIERLEGLRAQVRELRERIERTRLLNEAFESRKAELLARAALLPRLPQR